MEYLLPLIDRAEIAEATARFALDITGQNFAYVAGQHADFTLDNPPYTDPKGNSRIFSFVSSPTDRQKIEITTRLRDSAFKRSLMAIPLGTPVRVANIRGRLTLPDDTARPVAFLAGGIGITPFMSMIRFAAATDSAHTITLFYSNRSRAATAYLAELTELARSRRRFRFVPTLTAETPADWSGEQGEITIAMLQKHQPDLNQVNWFSAGPPAMVEAMITLLGQAGVAEPNLKSEDFDGYE